MSLNLNPADAKKADNFSNIIRDSGKYLGTITRAEKLLSKNGVEGVGLSFKSGDGESANYLDIYTVKKDGEKLRGYNLIQSLLCCLRLKTCDEGSIQFQRWSKEDHAEITTTATGYPAMMNKRIGVILQRELQTHSQTGEDVERIGIVQVFEATSGLSATEILNDDTVPKRVDKTLAMVLAKPVRDSRKGARANTPATAAPAGTKPDFDDDIPF